MPSSTWEVTGESATGGMSPHDAMLFDDDATCSNRAREVFWIEKRGAGQATKSFLRHTAT
jgi:hypothetical protein